jgi:AAA15 family ATPase/GTPase
MQLHSWINYWQNQEEIWRSELEKLLAVKDDLQKKRLIWMEHLSALKTAQLQTVSDIEQYFLFPQKIWRENSRILEQESEIQTRIDLCRSNIVEIRRKLRAISSILANREAKLRKIALRREERSLAEMIPPHEEGSKSDLAGSQPDRAIGGS